MITGGHVTPAYAVIQELQRRGYTKLFFLGRKYTDRAKKDVSFEYQEINRIGIAFTHLTTGRLSRTVSIYWIYDFFSIFYGFFMSLVLLNKIRPHVILSFGGYIALPVSIVAWFLGIRVVTHEQTIKPGLANKVIALIADKVLVSFPATVKQFPRHKTVLTGNPVRDELNNKGTAVIKHKLVKPLLFITGGSFRISCIKRAYRKDFARFNKKIYHTAPNWQCFSV
ncbi:MAG: UDP-N-acetylglucosamine--N-acetylmuramyl-(pentapeptide) pyrophosphoryl-undecaprenol N-acetylglucosamine transferase [Microgenomates bacterium OLB23]|nr:MAG: UDP-N-acetylglucosamine--N-acetylmuramyl-(pentapeptide) pyrophosphoryl-undecaprenol N-acetylglucosamine transferase [Microgenomates bacterium OLB23]